MTTPAPRTIALFGGTGKTGRHVLAQALAAFFTDLGPLAGHLWVKTRVRDGAFTPAEPS